MLKETAVSMVDQINNQVLNWWQTYLPCILLLSAWPFRRKSDSETPEHQQHDSELDLSANDYIDWGVRLACLGRYDRAEEKFRRAVEDDSESGVAHYNLALSLELQDRCSEALQSYSQACELAPESDAVLTNCGLLLLKLGHCDAAIAKLEEVIGLRPDDSDAHFNLGVACFRTGDFASAVTALQNAVELQPNEPELRFNLGLALKRVDRLEEARAEFSEFMLLSESRYPQRHKFAESLVNEEADEH